MNKTNGYNVRVYNEHQKATLFRVLEKLGGKRSGDTDGNLVCIREFGFGDWKYFLLPEHMTSDKVPTFDFKGIAEAWKKIKSRREA